MPIGNYPDRTCRVCGETVSSSGLAWDSHMKKHVRAGELVLLAHSDLPDRRPVAVSPKEAEKLLSRPHSSYFIVQP